MAISGRNATLFLGTAEDTMVEIGKAEGVIIKNVFGNTKIANLVGDELVLRVRAVMVEMPPSLTARAMCVPHRNMLTGANADSYQIPVEECPLFGGVETEVERVPEAA